MLGYVTRNVRHNSQLDHLSLDDKKDDPPGFNCNATNVLINFAFRCLRQSHFFCMLLKGIGLYVSLMTSFLFHTGPGEEKKH